MRASLAINFAVGATAVLACGPLKAVSVPTLFSTGMSDAVTPLPDTAIDPHYFLSQVPDGSGLGPTAYVVDSTLYPMVTEEWLANSATSKWISALADQTTFPNDPGSGNYVFRTTFDLTGFDPASAQISGRWAVDDVGLDILLNGVSSGFTHTQPAASLFYADFSIGAGFVPGVNTLDFLVRNEPFGGDINPMGFRAELSGRANLAVPGDFNHDGTVDAADYVVWRENPGGIYTEDDYNTWRTHFGQTLFTGSGAAMPSAAFLVVVTPEPPALILAVAALGSCLARRGPRERARTK